MVTTARDILARFRNSEYTGRNRCRPCTALNLAIAALVAGGLFMLSEPLGVVSFLGFAVIIYLRGYLVPGTPQLTRRYFPPWLRWFGKMSTARQSLPEWASVELSAELSRAGITADDGQPRLTQEFSQAWRARLRQLRVNDAAVETLATAIDADSEAISFREYWDGFAVSVAGVGAGRWPSRTAFEADLAAAEELRSRGVDPIDDISALASAVGDLRGLLSTCPACDGSIETAQRTAVACCGESVTPVRTCLDCGARLFEFEPEDGVSAA
jgi:hypothetical protein